MGTAHPAAARSEIEAVDVAERLQWLLRLRWLIVPMFIAVDLANDILMDRRAAWTTLALGVPLLAGNALYSVVLARPQSRQALLRWARLESAFVTALPALFVLLHGDPSNPLRYGVLVGVVGAAVALPRSREVALVAAWAIAALVLADALAMGLAPARISQAMVSGWTMEAGIIATVAILASHLHSERERSTLRLRSAAAGLEATRVQWDAAFDALRDVVLFIDEDGRVVRANRAFAKLLGARPHEVAGQRVCDLLAGHPERWWAPGGDGIQEIDDPLFETVFEVSSRRLGEDVLRVARDVGQQRRMYARLVQADKLAKVGVLSSGVAHDIANPTAFVTSNLTELKRYVSAFETAIGELSEIALGAGLAERVRAALARGDVVCAREEASSAVAESLQGMERVRHIAANLRSVARSDQAGESAAPLELGDLVGSVVRAASAELTAASARVDVRGPVWVTGHRGELLDVLLNLVVNAIQARAERRPNYVTIEAFRDGATAVIRVSDTGRGIPAEHLKRLFEPFFTTKAPGEGTGLGLSLARDIVVAHGGAIDVASEVGEGAVFTVRLPAIDLARSAAGARRPESGVA